MNKKTIMLLLALMVSVPFYVYATGGEFQTGRIYYNALTETTCETREGTASGGGNSTSLSGTLNIPSSAGFSSYTFKVVKIAHYSFANCSKLTSVVIPSSVTSLSLTAFSGCSGLIKSACPNSISNRFVGSGILIEYPIDHKTVKGCIHDLDMTTLYFAPLTLSDEYIVENTVTEIGDYAFAYCTNLSSITLPSSLTTIGEYVWKECSNINSVTCEFETPIEAPENTFDTNTYETATLIVPKGTKSKFKNIVPWSLFTNIKEDGANSDDNDEDNKETVNLEMSLSDNSMIINVDETAELVVTLVGKKAGNSTITVTVTDEEGNIQTETCDVVIQDVLAFINQVESNNEAIGDIYNLSGVLLVKNPSLNDVKALKTGIYIIGKKKVMVK